jgi:Protein of unknown function (DUF3261)
MPSGLVNLVILASLSVSLISCSSLPTVDYSESPEYLPLAQPIGPSRRIVQQIKAIWSSRQEILICVLELDKQHIAIAGLSNEGISLFNINYDGKTIKLDKSPLLPGSFLPELIIKDLQLAYWPLVELQKILPQQWRLESGINYRRLFFKDQRFTDIDYLQPDPIWAKSTKLTNHRYHYQLQIQTISHETLSE